LKSIQRSSEVVLSPISLTSKPQPLGLLASSMSALELISRVLGPAEVLSPVDTKLQVDSSVATLALVSDVREVLVSSAVRQSALVRTSEIHAGSIFRISRISGGIATIRDEGIIILDPVETVRYFRIRADLTWPIYDADGVLLFIPADTNSPRGHNSIAMPLFLSDGAYSPILASQIP